MKTQEEYAREIDEIVRRDVESYQSDWFKIDKEIFMLPENKNKTFILGIRKTGCDLLILGGTNCDESYLDGVFGCLGNEKFYVCQPISLYETTRNIQERPALYAFKIATAYFREQGLVPVFENSHCKLMRYSKLSEAVDDKMYFKYLLFNLGIVDRWKRGSDELIAELEDLCGKKWVNPYTPEKERFTLTLTDEERLIIEERIKAGYYSAENIGKRREEAHKAKMMEKRAEICERYDKKIRQAEAENKIMLCVFDYGLSTDNVIYYSHTNTLSFNWRDYGEKITQEEFDDFVNNVDRSQLPEGIKFELK